MRCHVAWVLKQRRIKSNRHLLVQTAWFVLIHNGRSPILLDQKFLYRPVHAAFVNTKCFEKWSERTLFVDPIIHDVQETGALSRMHGQPFDCHWLKTHRHWSRHTCCSVFVVVLSLITSWCVPRPAARVLTCLVRPVAVTRRILRWSQRFPLIRLCLVIFLSGDAIACICAFFFFCYSTQFFLHALAITADENRNFQYLLHVDRRQLQLSRRRCTAAQQAM